VGIEVKHSFPGDLGNAREETAVELPLEADQAAEDRGADEPQDAFEEFSDIQRHERVLICRKSNVNPVPL